MMEKIVKIQHVGPFDSLNSVGDTQFRKLTLIFGANGSGKSTLCSVLRAASRRGLLRDRHRLGVLTTPSVHLQVDGASLRKTNGAWSGPQLQLTCFDRDFVDRNVHIGGDVLPEQKQNLLQLALGESEVAAAQEVERLTIEIAKVTADRGQLIKQLDALANAFGLSVEDFVGLPPVENPTLLVEQLETERTNLKSKEEIRRRNAFGLLPMPGVEAFNGVTDLLARPTSSLVAEAESKVKLHLQRLGRSARDARDWVRQGLEYKALESDCPFCGQDVSGSELVNAFGVFFDEAYTSFLGELRRVRDAVQDQLEILGVLVEQHTKNSENADFWASSTGQVRYSADLDEFRERWRASHTTVLTLLDRKIAEPHQIVSAAEDLEAARLSATESVGLLAAINLRITHLNGAISELKKSLASASIQDIDGRLKRTNAAAARHETKALTLIAELELLGRQKVAVEQSKIEARGRLELAQASRLNGFEGEVNRILLLLGAPFSIAATKATIPAGRPSIEYALVVGNQSVPATNRPGVSPTFKTLLSDGDKNTLALALFFAALKGDPALADKVVVFDDPMCSLDEDRSSATRELLVGLLPSVKQLIVLSHLPRFLLDLSHRLPAGDVKTLQIKTGSGQLSPCDLRAVCRSEYARLMSLIATYARTGRANASESEIRRSLRIVLEEYLRLRFPHMWRDGEWLGDFVTKAKADQAVMRALPVSELENLNNYSAPAHHGAATLHATQTTPAELKTYCRRTYEFIAVQVPAA